jgi:hypothetical protein
VLQDLPVSTNSYTVTGLTSNTTYYYRVRANTEYDTDAQAFFNRVTTAGGSLTTTEQQATNTLVLDLKSYSIWTKMKALYPMVGGGTGTTAARQAACSQNLKSASFTGTFTATGWTYASTGATPNGTSAYMDTNCNDNNFSANSSSLGVYSRTNAAISTYDFGIYNTSLSRGTFMKLLQSSNFGGGIQSSTELGFANSDSRGFFQLAKNGSTTMLGYKNGSQVISGTLTTLSATNTTSFLGTLNNGGTPAFGYSNKEYSFAYLGDGLSGTDMSNFYTAVQAFQTTLSRQV